MDNFYRIKSYLMKDEKILWQGESHGKFRNHDSMHKVGTIIGGVFFVGFSLLWTAMALAVGAGVMSLVGLAFAAVGIFVIFGGSISQKRKLKNCYYAVTDRRILILCGNEVESVGYEKTHDIQIIHGDGDRGWIFFRKTFGNGGHYVNGCYVKNTGPVIKDSLQDIDNVIEVYRIILEEREKVFNDNGGNGGSFDDNSGISRHSTFNEGMFNRHYGNKP